MDALLNVVLPVFSLIAVGYVSGRFNVFGSQGVETLTRATFVVFMPALLFKAMANVDLSIIKFETSLTYFGSAVVVFLAVLVLNQRKSQSMVVATIRGFTAVFSNTVLLGIPIVQLAFGPQGLAILLMIVALHALILLTLSTVIIEANLQWLAAKESGQTNLRVVFLQTLKSAIIHPVVLPILLGLGAGLISLKLPLAIDQTLDLLAHAGPALSLVLLGASLVSYGVQGQLKAALGLSFVKLLVLPAVAFSLGRWGFELPALELAVVTLTAALPAGANSFLLANRYQTCQGETSATITLSTLLGVVTLSLLVPFLSLTTT